MANKDISIEILDDGRMAAYGNNMTCVPYFDIASDCWHTLSAAPCSSSSWTGYSTGTAIKLDDCGYLHNGGAHFVEGHSYEIRIKVRKLVIIGGNEGLILSKHGIGGTDITVLDDTDIPTAGTNTWAYVTKQWTQGPTNLNSLVLFSGNRTEMELDYVKVYKLLAAKFEVRGRLDASTTDDFPLAITFAVNDPSNIDARKGAYSKTFQIPATKNNNIVLKHLNIANSDNLGALINERLRCRILVGNLFSLVGLLQVKGIERVNNNPIHYTCVFLGDNLAWSTMMDSKYLSDLELLNSTGLKLGAKEIIKTWEAENCEVTQS